MTKLEYPFSESAVRKLRVGEAVSISGLVHTGRDKFHKWFADGRQIGVDFRDGALYHCGPVVVRDGGRWRVNAAGPTTSVRENPYEPEFIRRSGVRLIIGKGGMDAATLAAMGECGCVYIQAVGGAAAVSASNDYVRSSALDAFKITAIVPEGLVSMDLELITSEDASGDTYVVESRDIPTEIALQPVTIRLAISRQSLYIDAHEKNLEPSTST